jgi:branched-chain amino acid transport system permease protein
MTQLAQAVTSGVLVGLAYAILGVGFSLTWGASGVINASHAAFAVLGAYLGYMSQEWWGIDPLVALIGIVPLFFGIGVVFYESLVRPLKRRVANAAMASVVLTFGVALVVENLTAIAFTADPRVLQTPYVLATLRPGPIVLSGGQAVAAALAVGVLLAVGGFLYGTYTGRAARAVEQEAEGAMLAGVNVRRVNALTYGVAFATAGVAGVALSLMYAFGPGTQLDWLVITFLVVILGGVGSIVGVTVAGLIAGLAVTVSTLFVPYAWVNLVLFSALLLTLLFRPTGLFSR